MTRSSFITRRKISWVPDFKPISNMLDILFTAHANLNRIAFLFRQCRDLFSSILFATYFFIIHSCIPLIPEQPFKSIRCHKKPWHEYAVKRFDSISNDRRGILFLSFLGKISLRSKTMLFFFFTNIYLGINNSIWYHSGTRLSHWINTT